MYATCSFTHFDLTVKRGDQLPVDHPIVVARPDLFTPDPPTPPKAVKARKEK